MGWGRGTRWGARCCTPDPTSDLRTRRTYKKPRQAVLSSHSVADGPASQSPAQMQAYQKPGKGLGQEVGSRGRWEEPWGWRNERASEEGDSRKRPRLGLQQEDGAAANRTAPGAHRDSRAPSQLQRPHQGPHFRERRGEERDGPAIELHQLTPQSRNLLAEAGPPHQFQVLI